MNNPSPHDPCQLQSVAALGRLAVTHVRHHERHVAQGRSHGGGEADAQVLVLVRRGKREIEARGTHDWQPTQNTEPFPVGCAGGIEPSLEEGRTRHTQTHTEHTRARAHTHTHTHTL